MVLLSLPTQSTALRKRSRPWTKVNRKGVLDCEHRLKVNSPKETFSPHPHGNLFIRGEVGAVWPRNHTSDFLCFIVG